MNRINQVARSQFSKNQRQIFPSHQNNMKIKSNKKQINTKQQNLSKTKHQQLIEKLKKQTNEIKQLKKNVSSNTFSRLKQMKILSQTKIKADSQSNNYRIQKHQNKFFHKANKASQNLKKLKEIVNKQCIKSNLEEQQLAKNKLVQINTFPNQILEIQNNQQEKNAQKKQQQAYLIQNQQQDIKQLSYQNLIKQNQSKLRVQSKENQLIQINQNLKSCVKSQNLSEKINNYSTPSLSGSKVNENLISSKMNFNEKNLRARYEERLKQAKQKIKKSKVKIIQSQTNSKLQKKIKQNNQLIQKQTVLSEIVYRRMQRQRQRQKMIQKRRQERRFQHENKQMKVKIYRNFRKQYAKHQNELVRSQSQESLLNSTFKHYLMEKEDLLKKEKLCYNLEFLTGLNMASISTSNNPQLTHSKYSGGMQSLKSLKSSKSLKTLKIKQNFKV